MAATGIPLLWVGFLLKSPFVIFLKVLWKRFEINAVEAVRKTPSFLLKRKMKCMAAVAKVDGLNNKKTPNPNQNQDFNGKEPN